MRHIDEIAEYIAADSEFQAHRVVAQILDSPERVLTFPEFGAVVPEFEDPTLREYLVFSYRVLYRIRENGNVIRIVSVVHAARQLTGEMIE